MEIVGSNLRKIQNHSIVDLLNTDERLYEICYGLIDFVEGKEWKPKEISEYVIPYTQDQSSKIANDNLFQCFFDYLLKRETLGSKTKLSFFVKKCPKMNFSTISPEEKNEKIEDLIENIEKNEKIALFLMDFLIKTCSHKGGSREVDGFYLANFTEIKKIPDLVTFFDKFNVIWSKHKSEYFERKNAAEQIAKQSDV